MIKEAIREIIHDYKENHGITRSEMARRLQVHCSTLQEWENGTALPRNAEGLIRLLAITRTSPRAILREKV